MGLADWLGTDSTAGDDLPTFLRSVESVRGVRVMRVQGPVDASIGAEVTALIEKIEAAGGAAFERPLLFDLKASTACDFATVAYLVQALKKRVESGAGVGLVNAPAQLVAELEIAKLDRMFRVYASEDEAIAALVKPRS